MSDKNQNLIVLEDKIVLLINKLKQNYLDIKNLSDELEKVSTIFISGHLTKVCHKV